MLCWTVGSMKGYSGGGRVIPSVEDDDVDGDGGGGLEDGEEDDVGEKARPSIFSLLLISFVTGDT